MRRCRTKYDQLEHDRLALKHTPLIPAEAGIQFFP
jgi:hypothetical protein